MYGPLWALPAVAGLAWPGWAALILLVGVGVVAARVRFPLLSGGRPISFHPFLAVAAVRWMGFGLVGAVVLTVVGFVTHSVVRARGHGRHDFVSYFHTGFNMVLITAFLGGALAALPPLPHGFAVVLVTLILLAAVGELLSAGQLLLFMDASQRRAVRGGLLHRTLPQAVTLDLVGFGLLWGLAIAGGAFGFLVGMGIFLWFGQQLQSVFVTREQAAQLTAAQADARHDVLTTLPNRRALEEYAAQITAAGLPAVVAMADVDHFKAVNDTYGHDAGDAILFAVAQRLRNACRTQRKQWPDMVGRWGGEEFVLILPTLPADAAPGRVEAMRQAVGARPVRYQNQEVPITVSMGATLVDVPPLNLAEAVERCDKAVYRAKAGGRDCLRWHPDLLPASGAVTLHPVPTPSAPADDAVPPLSS